MNVRRSISIVFVAKYLEHGLALLSGVILARWLTPEDFGIYSIAASVVLLGYLFRNFGVGQYIVQSKNVTDDMLRAAFSVTLVISWGIGVMLILMAPFLGAFYAEDGITKVLYFLSLNFFLLPFGAVTSALLRRAMRFDKVAIIDISAAVASLVVGLSVAWFNATYMAIVFASNASIITSVVVTQFYRPPGTPWLPGIRHFRELMTFGAKVGAMDFSNSGSDSATELVIGRVHSLGDLGMYSRAYGTYRLFEFAFAQAIRPIVLPYLSRVKHQESDLGNTYLQIITYTAIFAIPFFTFLGANAKEMILILYGDQWHAAVPVLQIMCVAGALYAPSLFFEQLLIANGRPGQAFRFIATSQAVRLTALVLLVSISLEAAAVALIFGFTTRVLVAIRMARQQFSLHIKGFARALSPAIATSIALGMATWGARAMLYDTDSAILLLLVSAAAAGVTWLSLVFLMRHPIAGEIMALYRRLVQKA